MSRINMYKHTHFMKEIFQKENNDSNIRPVKTNYKYKKAIYGRL